MSGTVLTAVLLSQLVVFGLALCRMRLLLHRLERLEAMFDAHLDAHARTDEGSRPP